MLNDPRTPPYANSQSPGLPPVAPPTGKFLIQLFLVPGLIVALVVGLLLIVYWLINGPRSPESYLTKLDDSNPDIRWRAAADLAQVLPRDPGLAADAHFALQLADRLEKARAAHAPAEAAWAAKAPTATKQEAEVEKKRLEPERTYILYLASSLGHFKIPAGVFSLKEMATQEGGMEPRDLARQRRLAVWHLANLGESVSTFDKLDPRQQAAIVHQLDTAAEQGPRPDWARACRDYLRKRQEGHPDTLGVDKVLIRCSEDDNPFLREIAAFAMNFWIGTAKEEEALEEALVRLSYDNGRGEEKLNDLLEEEAQEEAALTTQPLARMGETRTLVKKKGYKIQATATITLARRGSTRTWVDLLAEMLDPDYLRQVFRTQNKQTEEEKPDEAVVTQTVLNALKALAKLHEKRPELGLKGCTAAVGKLVESDNAAIRKEAKETQNALNVSR
jgi:hypothetical protein